MPIPVLLAVLYLAVNLVLMVWVELGRARGERPVVPLATLAGFVRWGPPLAGAVYLVALSGDWAFVLFVLLFFAGAFWMLNGLLAFTTPPKGSRTWRGQDDDRG